MKHSLVRQTIVETASDLFYKNGYNRTGINEIIKEAGIAKATLYSHFKSKDDICLAYLDFRNSTFLTELQAFIDQTPSGKEQVLAIFDFLNSFFQDKDFNGCWCIKTVAEIPTDNDKIRSEIQRHKQLFLDLIQAVVVNNFPAHTDAEVLAKKIYLLYEGAVAESHLHQNPWPIESARSLCDLLIR